MDSLVPGTSKKASLKSDWIMYKGDLVVNLKASAGGTGINWDFRHGWCH